MSAAGFRGTPSLEMSLIADIFVRSKDCGSRLQNTALSQVQMFRSTAHRPPKSVTQRVFSIIFRENHYNYWYERYKAAPFF